LTAVIYSASLVTVYAALRPGDGFSDPHQEHMKDTYIPAPEVDAEILVPYARKSHFNITDKQVML